MGASPAPSMDIRRNSRMEIIHVKIEVPEAKREEFLKVARAAEEATQSDAGCLYYRFHQSVTDPGLFILVEEWSDADALAAHIEQPHVAAYRDASADLVERHEAELFEVASSKML
jgi:quinol monooxygenase YgiN